MRPAVALLLLLLVAGALTGCASPGISLEDEIKPPITLGPIHRIGVVVWPVATEEQHLFEGTILRNLEEVPGLHPIAIPVDGAQNRIPRSVPELAHLAKANDILLVHVLTHSMSDRQVIAGNCEAPPCQTMNIPMTIRTNRMRIHLVFLRAFPFHVELDRIVTVENESKKVHFSIFKRHFTPKTTLNLRLYAKISQHIRYLFSPLRLKVRRPFYPYNTPTGKAYLSLQKNKPVLALFFLNSEYGRLVKSKADIPSEFYADLAVTYEALRVYSLADYYYGKAAKKKNAMTFLAFKNQIRSILGYFIGINFFEKGS